MPRAPRTPAEQPPRRVWFDPRFAIGLVLIVASVVGVGWIVRSADDTVDVLAAASLLTPGDRLSAQHVTVRKVKLAESTRHYLAASALPEEGAIVTRAVGAGELIPVASLGTAASETLASVVLAVAAPLPEAIIEGSLADVWAARVVEGGAYEPPAVLVAGATVARVVETDGLIVDRSTMGVEVLIPRKSVAAVLDAMTGKAALSLVPASIPVGGR